MDELRPVEIIRNPPKCQPKLANTGLEGPPFNVFLTDPLEAVALAVSEDLVKLSHDLRRQMSGFSTGLDPSPTRFPRRLHDPRVATSIDTELPQTSRSEPQSLACLWRPSLVAPPALATPDARPSLLRGNSVDMNPVQNKKKAACIAGNWSADFHLCSFLHLQKLWSCLMQAAFTFFFFSELETLSFSFCRLS